MKRILGIFFVFVIILSGLNSYAFGKKDKNTQKAPVGISQKQAKVKTEKTKKKA